MRIDTVIAGAGQAAAQTALSLRQGGYQGTIAMIGEEDFPPYDRPPLSKDYLSGKREKERLFLRKPEAWSERGVTLRLGRRVIQVVPERRQITLDDGATLDYGWLVWATGGRPRPLSCPGANLEGVHAIRTLADIDRLKRDLQPSARIVIIGGGYIGLETAAVLRSLGHQVVVIEAQSRLLARVTSPIISRFFLDLHLSHGVEVRLDTAVAGLTGNVRVDGVKLDTGERLPADIVIVGIGILPNIEPLRDCGLSCPNGIEVDDHCRTPNPHILAIGDCALHPNAFASGPVRLESVQNAIDQAKTAASVIHGVPAPYNALPWFWSDQYNIKLQTAGLICDYDEVIVRGDPSSTPFTVAYLRAGRLIALDCAGAMKDFVQGKSLVQAQYRIDSARFADATIELKNLRADLTVDN